MKKIKLGNKVVVSDPCYSLGTWCMAVVEGVKAGVYHAIVTKKDMDEWGIRCSALKVVHAEYAKHDHDWVKTEHEIGVDSGQAGVFDFDSFRNDEQKLNIESAFTPNENEKGDVWYTKMCGLTNSDNRWGTYPNGVVSSSGIGDGGYDLYVSVVKGEVVGMAIDFLIDEDLEL